MPFTASQIRSQPTFRIGWYTIGPWPKGLYRHGDQKISIAQPMKKKCPHRFVFVVRCEFNSDGIILTYWGGKIICHKPTEQHLNGEYRLADAGCTSH
jgi:hypothetical protein